MSEIDKIKEVIAPHIDDMGFELVRIRLTGAGKFKTVQIMAEPKEHEKQMSVEDCEAISTRVSALLDVEDVVKGQYTLEVSSPGLDRPLTREKDFERFKETLVKIKTETAVNGQRNFKGRLKGLENKNVLIKEDGKEEVTAIPYAEIASAEVEWENPNAPKPKKGNKK